MYSRLAGQAIAVVSGKGGSGKTMIAATIASIAASSGDSSEEIDEIILVDTDFGTAGLTYYLGFNYVRNIRRGLVDVVLRREEYATRESVSNLAQPVDEITGKSWGFIPAGDVRRLMPVRNGDGFHGPASEQQVAETISSAIGWLRGPRRLVVVDCRGGVDDEMISVCAAVDEILLIAEPDTTSFQATQHVADALSNLDLAAKVTGVILNKVLEDSIQLQRNIPSTFGTRYLGSVPLDLEATRSFLRGRLPSRRSVFFSHVQEALSRAYPEDINRPLSRIWGPADYANLSVRTVREARFGLLMALVIAAVGLISLLVISIEPLPRESMIGLAAVLTVFGVLAGIDSARRLLVRLVRTVFPWLPRDD